MKHRAELFNNAHFDARRAGDPAARDQLDRWHIGQQHRRLGHLEQLLQEVGRHVEPIHFEPQGVSLREDIMWLEASWIPTKTAFSDTLM